MTITLEITPELEEVLNRKLVYRSQAEIVQEEFIRGRRSLVVAGTHGKTTTTSIAAWVSEVGGLDPSTSVMISGSSAFERSGRS